MIKLIGLGCCWPLVVAFILIVATCAGIGWSIVRLNQIIMGNMINDLSHKLAGK